MLSEQLNSTPSSCSFTANTSSVAAVDVWEVGGGLQSGGDTLYNFKKVK